VHLIALTMLTGDRAKYLGLIFPIAFCTFPAGEPDVDLRGSPGGPAAISGRAESDRLDHKPDRLYRALGSGWEVATPGAPVQSNVLNL
jgi:hypothetical protein